MFFAAGVTIYDLLSKLIEQPHAPITVAFVLAIFLQFVLALLKFIAKTRRDKKLKTFEYYEKKIEELQYERTRIALRNKKLVEDLIKCRDELNNMEARFLKLTQLLEECVKRNNTKEEE